MEEVKRIKLIRTQKLEDIPELIHHIQSLLPVEDAARTCVLSKSWLHAWSTNPNLRFGKVGRQNIEYMNLIDRTIQRYFRDNMPITSFQLMMIIDDARSYSFVNNWIRQLVTKSCFTEVYLILFIYIRGFYFCDELFSSENLKKVNLRIRSLYTMSWRNPISPITHSLASVRELCLDLMPINKSITDLLEYKFHFLESLNLKFGWCAMSILDIKCVSLKRLIMKVRQQQYSDMRVQVFAPKLIFFRYTGGVDIPSFLFSAIPKQVELKLKLTKPYDISFFLDLRETLSLSSKFNIIISCSCKFIKKFNIDIDDLRRQVPCPAMNVQRLSFGACFAGKNGRKKCPGKDLWAQSEFFDSFSSIFKPGCTKERRCIRPASDQEDTEIRNYV